MNRIDGEMVIVLNIECGMSWVRPPVGSNQSRTIKLVCIASPLGMQQYEERTKTGWLGIRIICRMELRHPVDSCLSELAL
jgi:hypothetical protein